MHRPSSKIYWLTAIVIAALSLYAGITMRRGPQFERKMERAIHAATANDTRIVLDLGELADFEWDRVCIFGPYTDQRDINTELGFKWNDRASRAIAFDDGHCLFVFTKRGAVEGHWMLRRDLCDFRDAAGCFSRPESMFEVDVESGEELWRTARWKDSE